MNGSGGREDERGKSEAEERRKKNKKTPHTQVSNAGTTAYVFGVRSMTERSARSKIKTRGKVAISAYSRGKPSASTSGAAAAAATYGSQNRGTAPTNKKGQQCVI